MHEAELLFTEILNCDRLSLYLNKDSPLDKDKSKFISRVLKRRMSGEPMQYILGKHEFMGLVFKVNKDVFIPRPETEILVEAALRYASCVMPRASCVNLLDIGTGSGCIAVSLAKFLPDARVAAVDISKEALKIARVNAKLHNVNISFIHGDLFYTYNLQSTTYHLIVSNPPYIPTRDIDELQPEIRFEPRIALDGGRDGFDFYRKIIAQAPEYLKEDGFLIMEMGFNQAHALKEILCAAKDLDLREIIKDYNNIERVAVIKRKKRNG